MQWLGDYHPANTIDFKFTTMDATGAGATLGGSPVVSLYSANGTVESATGVTLTVDFDGRTGLNHVRIVGTTAGLTDGKDYSAVITAGTVSGVSVVGYVIAQFSTHNRSSHEAIYLGSVTGSSTTTGFADSALPATQDNTYRYRVIIVDTGTYAGAVTDIKTYTASTKLFTFTALPGALTVGDKYRII